MTVLGDFRQIRPGFCIEVGLYGGGGGGGAIQHPSPYIRDRWQIGHHRQLFPFSRAFVTPHEVVAAVVVGGGGGSVVGGSVVGGSGGVVVGSDVLQQDLVPIHGRLLYVQTTTATSIQPKN